MQIPQISFNPKAHKSIGIEVVELSDIYTRSINSEIYSAGKPHRIGFHNLVYISEGCGHHIVDFNTYHVEAGSVVFINKNQVQAFDLDNKPQGKVIIFTDEFMNSILSTVKLPMFAPHFLFKSYSPVVALSHELNSTFSTLLSEIENEFALATPNTHFMDLLFCAMLTKMTALAPDTYMSQLSERHTAVFIQFTQHLALNFTQLRDAVGYAKMLNLTYKSLNQICKLATGQTAKQLIDAYIILEAKRKLSIEHIRVQQLAYELGFEEVTNFVKYFKNHTKLTPTQFKNSIQG